MRGSIAEKAPLISTEEAPLKSTLETTLERLALSEIEFESKP